MEQIRSIKINVEVDTNKTTHKKEFEDIVKASEWLEEILESIE